jgi:hypothetical protein
MMIDTYLASPLGRNLEAQLGKHEQETILLVAVLLRGLNDAELVRVTAYLRKHLMP